MPETLTVFKISRPARTTCVRLGEMSRAAMGMPVLCVVVLDDNGLGNLSATLIDYQELIPQTMALATPPGKGRSHLELRGALWRRLPLASSGRFACALDGREP